MTEPGEQERSLLSLADDYWELWLRENPLGATALGDRRFDNRLPDITPAGKARRQREYGLILQRCEAMSDVLPSRSARITRSALLAEVRSQLEFNSSGLEFWSVDPLGGPQVEFANVESYQPVRTPQEGSAMISRWRAMGRFLEESIANMRSGISSGRLPVSICVEKTIDETKDLLAKPDEEWTLFRPSTIAHEDWTREDLEDFRTGLSSAIKDETRPGFGRYLAFLEGEVLPVARSQERPGMVHVPGGSETYARLIRAHTSLDPTPEQLHQTGLREVARINAEMENLGGQVLGTSDRKDILRRLRSDPSLHFSSRDEVEAKAETALAKAKSAIPRWFGRLPKTDCEVVRMEEHEEKHSTIAYYRPPAADGSRPGRYYINTSAPETRPRYEAETLAYHESIPGHHLQIAIAQELEGIPDFRKFNGVTAFIEGWGLYTERLADEMGLYSSDLDRMGILSYDSWRACRLVVDTGMHAKGWTRAQAIEFMLQNTALAENNIVNEVDRYISWPGQALAYKTGQLEIIRLRRKAEERLGKRFDIREFHDVVLGDGAVPLETLGQMVEDYLNEV
jgi:uncharacterized protein (DUF885 family)